MPYKDAQQKRQWERVHRRERLARRRQLRSIESARTQADPELHTVRDTGAGAGFGFLVPIAASATLAGYNPDLAIGAGGMTLLMAALSKKSWHWWFVGAILLAMGLFFQWNKDDAEK